MQNVKLASPPVATGADGSSDVAHYVFSSHDGYGLGHVRRNSLIARAIIDADPTAQVTLVTGVRVKPSWLSHPRISVVQVPPMLKQSNGAYRHESLDFEDAVAARAALFSEVIERLNPAVVIVDRHPFGVAGELRHGLRLARQRGGHVVLGLRDILDEPDRIHQELAGAGWDGVTDTFNEVLVYGDPVLCDHDGEYGLPMTPRYCGWVVEAIPPVARDRDLIAVTAGGGGDGVDVFRLGLNLLRLLPKRRGLIIAGPYAHSLPDLTELPSAVRRRLELVPDVPGCGEVFAGAGAIVQMAGYNSTFESLAAGIRPILVPRRSPRREQAIRATRLAALGLADTVDEGAPAEEVAWLLGLDRQLRPDQLAEAGIRLHGAQVAALHLVACATARRAAR